MLPEGDHVSEEQKDTEREREDRKDDGSSQENARKKQTNIPLMLLIISLMSMCVCV